MKFLVISNAPIIYQGSSMLAYSPYVNELEIWQKYVDSFSICCPVWKNTNGLLVKPLPFPVEKHYKLHDFNLNSLSNILKSIPIVIHSIFRIFSAMYHAEHIHIRCPGNIGLLACIAQLFFPNKTKTVKYAGNWDPNSVQPLSYRLQRWIISSTFLSRKIKVLVYGKWVKMSSNIVPFFTATYNENEKIPLKDVSLNQTIRIVFVGALLSGKNPMYAIQLIQQLKVANLDVILEIYGEGPLRKSLQDYIALQDLENVAQLKGNTDREILKEAYRNSDFVILPSESEGWPKAIAEAMFWGCIPIATNVSCVSYMLDFGNRGLILSMDLKTDTNIVQNLINDQKKYQQMRLAASTWSRFYTTDLFETEIKKLLES